MKTIRSQDNNQSLSFNDWIFCIVSIWITVFYSVIIQYKYIEIPNGMLILGLLVLLTFVFSCSRRGFTLERVFTRECWWMLAFMIYMLPIGMITSPDSSKHLAQWITSMEYMFMMIVISSVIMELGTDSFHIMLFLVAVALAAIFLQKPVLYVAGGRYSISKEVNPNSLGITFATGIWAILYYQQKKNKNVLIPLAVTALLFYCIFKTGSRKSLIAAGIMVILWYAFCYIPQTLKKESQWKGLILFLSVLLIAYLGILFIRTYSGSDIEARMEGLDNEVTSGSRSTMYKNGWELFKANPLFGLGFQGYKYYYRLYSHATLVEIPVSGGIVGTVLYFAAYGISIRKCIELFKWYKNGENPMIYVTEIKMIIILWIATLFYCTCIIHPYQFDSYIIFGLIFGQTSHIEKMMKESSQQKENKLMENKCKWIR